MGRQRSLFTARSSVSGTILRKGRPKAPSNLNGRPYRKAHATEKLSPFPSPPPRTGPQLHGGGKPARPQHCRGSGRSPHPRRRPPADSQPRRGESPRRWDRSRRRPAARPRQRLRPHRPAHYSPVHRRAGQSADKRDRQPRGRRVRGDCEKMAARPARKPPNVAECRIPLLVPRRYRACASRAGMRRRRR